MTDSRHQVVDRYSYDSLPQKESIRVLILQPGSVNDPVHCTLRPSPDFQTGLQYDALSYVWGDTDETVQIICEGKLLSVTRNLDAALRRLRLATESRTIWADAICINQQDVTERSQQVSIMKHIFAFATRVWVWLGPADEYTKPALSLLREIARYCCESSFPSQDPSSWPKMLREQKNFRPLVHNVEIPDLSPSSQAWRPVFHLFQTPWFSRVWVIQEVRGCPDVVMLIGPEDIDWDIVSLAASWAIAGPEVNRIMDMLPFDAFMIFSAEFMRDKDLVTTLEVPFLRILWLAQRFKATDPRDKIFSLLDHEITQSTEPQDGPVNYTRFPLVSESNKQQKHLGLRADYSLSPLHVIREVVLRSIDQHRCLEALSFAQGLTLEEDTPSWVARWDRHLSTIVHPLQGHLYDARFGTKSKLLPSVVENSLSLEGIQWDIVAEIPDHLDMDNTTLNSTYVTGEDMIITLSRLLIADSARVGSSLYSRRAYEVLETHLANFSAYLLPLLERYKSGIYIPVQRIICDICDEPVDTNQTPNVGFFYNCLICADGDYDICAACFASDSRCLDKQHEMQSRSLPSVFVRYHENLLARLRSMQREEGNRSAFNSEAQNAVHKRVFFKTSKGYLGVGPQLMQAGDVVCVLFGGRVPFILRPTKGFYQLVGECYVHGIMDGEAVQMWKDGELDKQHFDLQ